MFDHLVKPNRLTTNDSDFRRPFDPTDYPMFRRYETGYCIFLVMDIPNMLTELTKQEEGSITKIKYRQKYADLICSYVRTLEREFKHLEGLENISSESIEFSGLNEVSVTSINSVQEAHNTTISLTYTEPYGEPLTKVNELYLKGIDDPIIGHRKHYNGLIDDKLLAPSFKNEVFSFLYLITDNTGLQLEKAYYIFNAQPTTSHTGDIYNFSRGDYENKEITIDYKCNILANEIIYDKALTILNAITGYVYASETDKFVRVSKPLFEPDSSMYNYRGLTDPDKRIGGLNFSGNEIEYISALKKAFDLDYPDIDLTAGGINSSLNSFTKRDYKTINDGDTNASSIIKTYKCDKPLAQERDTLYIKKGAKLANSYGNKIAPDIITFDNKYSPVVKCQGHLSESAAQIWVNENKYEIVYGGSAKIYAYRVKLGGQSYYLKATDFYILDGDIWRDPITKLEIDIVSKDPLINVPLYKVGDKVKIQGYAPIFSNYVTNSYQGTITSSDKVFVIESIASEDIAKQVMEKYNTNYPYAHPNFHPYCIDVTLKEGDTPLKGYFNEEDLQLVEEGSSGGETKPDDKPVDDYETNLKIAKEVIIGKWSAGVERKKLLTEAGYNYRAIQDIVNKIIYG